MENKHNKSAVITSLIWKLMERSGVQGVQFIVQIILARLLLPEDYGIIALIAIFITIANVFVQSGFNTALIQKKDTDETDFSSVFYLSLFISAVLYTILFFTAPSISSFYNEPKLVIIIRILSITLFFGVFNSIQYAIISRTLQFKKLFISSVCSVTVSGIISIILAYTGFGVWALVTQQIINQFLVVIVLWFLIKWRPKLIFSIKKVKSMFSYGWKLLVSSLIDTLYMDLRSLIIGKVYSSATLGFYNRGKQFPQYIVTNVNGSIQSVMLPVLSSEQDNRNKVKDMVRRSISISSFIIFPTMVGLAVVAEPMIKIILTEKWLPAVPFLQIYCITYALLPIHTANLQAINALGRSDIFLKLEIIKKVIGLSILFISLNYGVYAIALGGVVSGIISSVVNAYPNKKLLGYSYLEQIKDIIPSLFLSLFMGIVAYSIKFLGFTTWVTLFMQITSGVILYYLISKLLKIECFNYLKSVATEFIRK